MYVGVKGGEGGEPPSVSQIRYRTASPQALRGSDVIHTTSTATFPLLANSSHARSSACSTNICSAFAIGKLTSSQ